MEALIAAQEVRDMERSRSGSLAPITCPECHGAMQEIRDGALVRYRCHTGHAFTLESLNRSTRRHGSAPSTAPFARSRNVPWWFVGWPNRRAGMARLPTPSGFRNARGATKRVRSCSAG